MLAFKITDKWGILSRGKHLTVNEDPSLVIFLYLEWALLSIKSLAKSLGGAFWKEKWTKFFRFFISLNVVDNIGGEWMIQKLLQSWLFWPTLFMVVQAYVKKCDQLQWTWAILRRHKMPLNNILDVEFFNIWA